MRISDLIKRLERTLYEYGNLPVTINANHALNDVILYDENNAPEDAKDFDGDPVEVSLED